MIQYTTPTDVCVVHGIDLTGCDVWVSYQQRKAELDVKASSVTYDGEDSTVSVELTQEQTAKFKAGTVEMQVNWVTPQGKRDATTKKSQEVLVNLLERVVEYGDD